MAFALRVCLFDMSEEGQPSLGPAFEGLGDLRIVAQCNSWEQLQGHLRPGQVDIVAVNLDTPDPRFGLQVVQSIAEGLPSSGILGISAATDPNAIIAAMRSGCHQFVRAPIDVEDLRAALERMRQTLVPTADSKRIGIIGACGGAGSTTIACNLAIELAHLTARSVGLVDMNLQFGDVACAFDCQPRYSVADVCRDQTEIDRTLLETAMHELPCNVSVLARPEKVEDGDEIYPETVDQLFRALAEMYPFVVMDLPRLITPPVGVAISGADRLVIVAQLSVPCLRNATRLYECLLNHGMGAERVEIVLNRCNANYERIKPEEVEQHFGRPVFAVIPNDYRRVTTSRDLGQPMMNDSPNSPARMAIHNMARGLAGQPAVTEEAAAATNGVAHSNGGLLSMFRKKKPAVRPA